MLTLLPSPRPSQAFFKVTPLYAGYLTAPEQTFVTDVDPKSKVEIPSIAFLLQHSTSKYNILFDLGIKKNVSKYSPASIKWIENNFRPCSGDPDVLDSLLRSGKGVKAKDVTHIIISHLHW